MTQKPWLRRVLAATRATRRADDFCQRSVLPRGSGSSHKMYRVDARRRQICSAESCRTSLRRATSAPRNGGASGGNDAGVLRAPKNDGRTLAGRGATTRDSARRARRRDHRHGRRRTCPTAVGCARRLARCADQRRASRARHEAPRAASTRVPALRVDAPLDSRDLSALRQSSGGGGCR